MEYKVIETKSLSELEDIVNELMKIGWTCQGGVAIAKNSWDKIVYVQALARETLGTEKF